MARFPGNQLANRRKKGVNEFSSIDVLNIRDNINATGMGKKDVDVSALYIPAE